VMFLFILVVSGMAVMHVSTISDSPIQPSQHRKFVGDFAAPQNDKLEFEDKDTTSEVENKDLSVIKAKIVTETSMIPKGCLKTISSSDRGIHIVPPPAGLMTLVCCQTTKGLWNIAVHPNWAPIGASNFLSMVKDNFFSSKVPLFRALKGFLIQFGLSSDPKTQVNFEHNHLSGKGGLKDDPQWLPAGPPGRKNAKGIERFRQGYLSYAGAGKNSRGTQLILAFKNNLYLGGGSPWEVPWGQLHGEESYKTLNKIYTGYGEKISQGKIRNRGLEYLNSEFPEVDYITSCEIMAENVTYEGA